LVLADSDSVVASIPVAGADRTTAFISDVQISAALHAAMARRPEVGHPVQRSGSGGLGT
jgi:hypothetical protein